MAQANTAPIKWAQRSDSLYLTIALPDVTDETINLTDTALVFKGKSGGQDYTVDIEFYKEVSASGSTYKVLPRSVQMHIIKKKEESAEFWPRLLKDKEKEKNQVKIDWDRYVDEDEQDGGFDTSALDGGMDFGGMGGGGMGGMDFGGMGGGGMGGMDMEALMKQMGGMKGGMGEGMGDDFGDGDGDSDDGDGDDEEALPDLEEVN